MEIYQTEEQQVDAIKSYLKENGMAIGMGLLVGFAGFIGFNVYKDNKLEQEMIASDNYQIVLESSAKDEEKFIASANKFITDNKSTSYASLTALALAKDTASHQDWAQTEKHLITAIEKAPSDGIKGIATLRLARVQIQLEQLDKALTTLSSPLVDAFKASVEETKGDAYLKQGKTDLARNAYQAAIDANGSAPSTALQMKLNDLVEIVNLNSASIK